MTVPDLTPFTAAAAEAVLDRWFRESRAAGTPEPDYVATLLATWAAEAAVAAVYPLIEQAVRAESDAEIARLARWKAEAKQVVGAWEGVHASLGHPGDLGQSKAAASIIAVQRLTAERDEARAEVARLLARETTQTDDGAEDAPDSTGGEPAPSSPARCVLCYSDAVPPSVFCTEHGGARETTEGAS